MLSREELSSELLALGIPELVVDGRATEATARVAVVTSPLPTRRLPTGSTHAIEAGEHEVRSTVAEVLTATLLALRDAVDVVRRSPVGQPRDVVVVAPPGGVGRPGHGMRGVIAAGLGALVRTLAAELAGEHIAVNAVQVGESTTPAQASAGVAAVLAAKGALSGQILRVGETGTPVVHPPAAAVDTSAAEPAIEPEGGSDAQLAGRVALVTGAVRPPHMGRATAVHLARSGADLVIVDDPAHGDARSDSDATGAGDLEELGREIEGLGRRCVAIPAQISGLDQAHHLVETAVATLGRLDIACHLGGGTGPRLGTGPLLEIELEAWNRGLEANLLAPWWVASAVARHLRATSGSGSIAMLSSYAVVDTPDRYGAFSAARAVVVALAEQIAFEVGAAGVRANTVLPLGVKPGDAPNPGLADLVGSLGTDPDSWARTRIPAGRMQLPVETAAVFAFLASDHASFVNGQAIAVSGGATERPLW